MRTIKSLLFVVSIVLLSGCKLAVINVEGGEVQSIGSGTCVAGTVCIINVADTTFSETFIAVPDQGWYFEKWNSGDGFICGGSSDRECSVSNEGASGNAALEALIASSETFFLMPILKRARPITDTISVAGREWAQVDLFADLSWNDINTICPAGLCSGVLNGFDMTGWMWASVEDLNSLFNHYIGFAALGPGPDTYGEGKNSTWAPAFFNDGWRPNNPFGERAYSRALFGPLRDRITVPGGEAAAPGGIADVDPTALSVVDLASTEGEISLELKAGGSWFYRIP